MNIHLPLIPKTFPPHFGELCPYDQAMETNLLLGQTSQGTEELDFFQHHTPHITLYLTDFDVHQDDDEPKKNPAGLRQRNDDHNNNNDNEQPQQQQRKVDPQKLQNLLDAMKKALNHTDKNTITPCRVDWHEPVVLKGAYAMYNVPPTDCLQYLSDTIVNATHQYIKRPPTIPDWIFQLPLDQRRAMLERIERYGSPNVYEGFVPHVTVGYDTAAITNTTIATQRSQTLHSYSAPQPCFGNVSTVAIAKSGIGGSVLQNGLLLEVSLANESSLQNHMAPVITTATTNMTTVS